MTEAFKYRIIAWLAEIAPKASQVEAREEMIRLLGMSERSFKRKLYAKLGQDEPAYEFKEGHLEIILRVLNEYRPGSLPVLSLSDLYNPALLAA